MPTKITADFLNPYTKDNKRHKAYAETVQIMKRMKVHAHGENPGDLISKRRPSESEDVQKYREEIFVAITKFVFTKILNCLAKIRKSQDWSIRYDPSSVPDKIRKGETLEDYCETNYPYFGSLTNWVFNVLLQNYLMDPNAVCLELPLEIDIAKNDYLRPYTLVFNSDRVLDFVEDDYAVIHSTDVATYEYQGQKFNDGNVYYIVSTTEIQKWEQTSPGKEMTNTMKFAHGLGKLPCYKVKGLFKKAMDTTNIWQSRIDDIIPRLNEAVREYSDLQGGVVTSLNMEKWAYVSQDCPECNGTTKVKNKTGSGWIKCKACKGSGSLDTSPFSIRPIKAPKAGEAAVPTPPAGFITKPVEILILQDQRVEKHMWWALCAVNMEFLVQTPLVQSGVAKEWDRDEFNNFVNAVAEDIVALMDKSYWFKNEYRNRIIVPEYQKRIAMLPKVAVPEKFDMVNSAYLAQELVNAKTANVNPLLMNALQVEFANKKLQNSPEVKAKINLVFDLDPFPGKDGAEKMTELQNGGITLEDFVISCNIVPFVNRAIFESGKDNPFTGMPLDKQMVMMRKFAQEKIKANSAAAEVMKVVQDDEEEDGPAVKPAASFFL